MPAASSTAADRMPKLGPALKVVQEGLQDLIQDLIRGLGRMDVTPARPVADPDVQLPDAEALQGVLRIVGDSRPVGARHDLGGIGFSQLAQVRPGSEQLIQHGGLLPRGQGVQRRPLIAHPCSPFALGRSLLEYHRTGARARTGRTRATGGAAQRPILGCHGCATPAPARRSATPGLRRGRRCRRTRCQPAHRPRRCRKGSRREPGRHRSLARGSCPERTSFSASSHSSSAPSA